MRLGPWQAVWLMLGFGLVQFAGGALAVLGYGVVARLLDAHLPAPPPSPQFIALATIGAYVVAGLWCLRFVRRRAAGRLHDGTPTGIGLCPAPGGAYAAAVVLAALVSGVVMVMFRIVPPARHAADQAVFVRALDAPGGPSALLVALILALILVIAPLVEEFVFRGAAMAGFAARLGPLGGGAITTAAFVLAHAPEKLRYPPGFLDVALLAVAALWLRLRYRSIRPAMLCHALYNFGVIVAAALR